MFGQKYVVLVIFILTAILLPSSVFAATQQDKDAILSEFSKFIDKNPEIIRGVVYSIANEYSREQKTDEAIALFQKALKIDPGNEDFLNRLGDLYNQKADYAKVVEVYKKLTAAKPDNAWYFQRLSDALKNSGDEAGAVKVWDDLVAGSKNAEVFMQAANFYSNSRDMDKAIAAAKKAVDLAKENPGYLQGLGSLYVRAEKFADAEAVCKQALAGAKDQWMKDWANSELINIYQRQGKLDELAARFEKDLAAAPKDLSQYKKLADLYQRGDNRDKAIEVYEKAVAEGAADRDVNYRLLDMYEWSGKSDKAEAQIKKVIAASPDDNYLYERMANILDTAGKKDEAKKAWQQFLQKVPNDAGAFSRYADKLAGWQDVDAAIQQYKKAQSLDQRNVWYTMRLADLLAANKRLKEAKKELEGIIAGDSDEGIKNDAKRRLEDIAARMAVGQAAPEAVSEAAPEAEPARPASMPEPLVLKMKPGEKEGHVEEGTKEEKPEKKRRRGWFGR